MAWFDYGRSILTCLSCHPITSSPLQDLERKNKTAVGNAVGGLDAQARIPWRPNGWGTSVGTMVEQAASTRASCVQHGALEL